MSWIAVVGVMMAHKSSLKASLYPQGHRYRSITAIGWILTVIIYLILPSRQAVTHHMGMTEAITRLGLYSSDH
jgi:hypothetical protein